MDSTIELRSDTFTKPSVEMLQSMMDAQVGDDVFGEDPTVNKLEEMVADKFGMEAALFCPTGTMTNQIAIKCHTQPGDEIICEELSHVYQYEGGGIAFNSLCATKLIQGDRGRISAEKVLAAINPYDIHKPVSKLVCLENTTNRGGGACYDFKNIIEIKNICINNDLLLHLDGARLFNAMVCKGETATQYGHIFDSISICFSKGLGTAAGSVLTGSDLFIKKARRIRKILGGGMRQTGYLAAACIYALENNIERLATDHQHAKIVSNYLAQKEWVGNILPVETNILIFSLQEKYTASEFINLLASEKIACMAITPTQIRMVFHLGITSAMTDRILQVLSRL